LRKAEEGSINTTLPCESLLPVEIELIKSLCDYPNVVAAAGEAFAPSMIANYTYELAKQFNGFYHDHSILREENEAVRAMRIRLAASVAKVIRLSMKLLGIDVPERM
jgi:arginyl-tRNA synthetase